MDLNEFYSDFAQLVKIRVEVSNNFSRAAMAEIVTEWLQEEHDISNYTPAYFENDATEIDGYSFSDKHDAIDLFYFEFKEDLKLSTINAADYDKIFSGMKKFFTLASQGKLHDNMEESSPAYGMTWDLHNRAHEFSKVRFFLVTNRELKTLRSSLPDEEFAKWTLSRHIYDIKELSEYQTTERKPLVISFTEKYKRSLPCLPAHSPSTDCKSYLAVIPGDILADLYKDHGPRLLEQNVRTFLQVRGKVNKGIRQTIIESPSMFFVYNNGISATASDATLTDDKTGISSITDLQIVNGGQTTASIYHASKSNTDISQIFVQMKLSVVDNERIEEIVPRISACANTQNKIDNADFFSNHPFHIRIEEFSRRISAPAAGGSLHRTKWFYERARGQFHEAMNRAKKAEFQKQYPAQQVFSKTDLAKFEHVWADDDAATIEIHKGAQKNFALFAKRIGEAWDKDNTFFNERYYKKLISRAIMFRATEKLISSQDWYDGGYRAQIVSYSQSLLGYRLSKRSLILDWDYIWSKQSVPTDILDGLAIIAKEVNDSITHPPSGMRNISEWCKKTLCWDQLKALPYETPEQILKHAITIKEDKARSRGASETQTLDNGIAAQKFIIEKPKAFWEQIENFCKTSKTPLTENERGILHAILGMHHNGRIPSEKKCIGAIAMLKRLEAEGLNVPLQLP